MGLFSCHFKTKKDVDGLEVFTAGPTEEELNALDDEESGIEINTIGGEGVTFETSNTGEFVMSFSADALEKAFADLKNQLKEIKIANYESEDLRKSAIESMKLNMELFKGEFCCKTHSGKHCDDSKNLKRLEKEFKCLSFIKKI
jgi:hypothetical protein